jgi:hypothetical protein
MCDEIPAATGPFAHVNDSDLNVCTPIEQIAETARSVLLVCVQIVNSADIVI